MKYIHFLGNKKNPISSKKYIHTVIKHQHGKYRLKLQYMDHISVILYDLLTRNTKY